MALQDLVRYVGRCSATRLVDLYQAAAKYDWDAGDVQAFLRCQKLPPRKMLREMLRELDIRPEYADELLKR